MSQQASYRRAIPINKATDHIGFRVVLEMVPRD